MNRSLDQRGGSLFAIRNFVNVLKEISFDEVREQAETMPRLLVLAPTTAEARELGLRLTGHTGELAITARELSAPPADLERFDAVVVSDPAGTGLARSLRDRQMLATGASVVQSYIDDGLESEAALDSLRHSIVRAALDRAPAFGRAFPVFRPAAARAVVNEASMANAQFALISNIPALIPIVGGLASAGADLIVLTKNQMMMMYKLGAMNGRDLHDQFAIIQELVPVVGAGFLWRSIARGASSMLPFAAGTIPKVSIAYAGTMAMGLAAEHFYRTGLRPTRDQLKSFRRQAMKIFRRLPIPLIRQRSADDASVIETSGSVKTDHASDFANRQLSPPGQRSSNHDGDRGEPPT
ncbi:MAG: hypothetical protein M3464_03380 [Chloroflexota bacterium]|nr:hypothetical protein [Chloroflexota bacterium]